ncbi:TatD DNase family protein [Pseudomonas sp. NFACC19-2]|nr:Qat anti-phage system TatD family nuclease QatD [Pseudomonas sp. NFACC19-2]SFW13166.1 TatD DNase family protein [Pseudomonas sp. NFACC19-2]
MIDFHCHLDLYPDPLQVARDCIIRNIYVLSVTTTPSAWPGTTALAHGGNRIRTALGLHPQIAHLRKSELPLFEQLLPQARYVGEVGLDGGAEYKKYWDDQEEVFHAVLRMCESHGGRIMSLHSRHAAIAVMDILEMYPRSGIPIFHWFSGTQAQLKRAITLGSWFSVGPVMLASKKGRSLVEQMPRDKVLTESDGPFARVDGRSLFPWEAGNAINVLADIWLVTELEAKEQLLSNLRKLASL